MSKLYNVLEQYLCTTNNISKNGVYVIYHISKPHLKYIGSTCRNHTKKCKKGIYGRCVEHFSLLKRGLHHSFYLQNVVNKYGLSGIKFDILYTDDLDDENFIREKEKYFIDMFDSVKNGYNTNENTKHVAISIEGRKRLSDNMRLNNPMFNKQNVDRRIKTLKDTRINRGVLQYSKEGELLNKFNNFEEASKEVNIDASNICRACNGETKTSGKYIWIYEDIFTDKILQNKIKELSVKITRPTELVNRLATLQCKIIRSTRIKDNFEQDFSSIKEAGEILNLDTGNISKCCNGKQKTCKGYKFKFL